MTKTNYGRTVCLNTLPHGHSAFGEIKEQLKKSRVKDKIFLIIFLLLSSSFFFIRYSFFVFSNIPDFPGIFQWDRPLFGKFSQKKQKN